MASVWGPQVYEYETHCPYCGSDRCRIRWSPRSVLRIFAQAGMGLLYRYFIRRFTVNPLDEYLLPWKLLRRCLECGSNFDPTLPPMWLPECGGCGIDLTDTQGDSCPECGWHIPLLTWKRRNRQHAQ